MKQILVIATAAVVFFAGSKTVPGQQPSPYDTSPPADSARGPVVLDWTPPALGQLSARAAVKNSFTLDRNMLGAAAGLSGDMDEPTRQAINHLDGVSVHLLRFGATGVPDEGAVSAIREAYHLRGWKHVVTSTNAGGPIHNGTTDVWMVMDGVNMRGAVVLAETPKSVTLVTVAGNLSPVDLLHLRGHFGIPRFDQDGLPDTTRR
ncbi:MAG TPA: hypothetical protein VGG85_05825 [Terracidiphilus sp.]|jgi:hypothetical protein